MSLLIIGVAIFVIITLLDRPVERQELNDVVKGTRYEHTHRY